MLQRKLFTAAVALSCVALVNANVLGQTETQSFDSSATAEAAGWIFNDEAQNDERICQNDELCETDLGWKSSNNAGGEAAGEGAGIAHQVHGAIGFTMEHILHRYSRRVWSWRDEFGSESIWAVRLGEAVAAKGSDALWATLASR